MYHILIDGDNISVDKYIEHILPLLKIEHENVKTTVFIQNNFKIKYLSNLKINVNIEFSKTRNKNATDSRIIYEAGKSSEKGEEVIIVSNDKIFEELEESGCNVKVYGYNKCTTKKGYKLKKKNIIACLKMCNFQKNKNEDVLLSDFQFEYFTHIQKEILHEYITNHIPDIEINGDDCIYFKKSSKYNVLTIEELD